MTAEELVIFRERILVLERKLNLLMYQPLSLRECLEIYGFLIKSFPGDLVKSLKISQ